MIMALTSQMVPSQVQGVQVVKSCDRPTMPLVWMLGGPFMGGSSWANVVIKKLCGRYSGSSGSVPKMMTTKLNKCLSQKHENIVLTISRLCFI